MQRSVKVHLPRRHQKDNLIHPSTIPVIKSACSEKLTTASFLSTPQDTNQTFPSPAAPSIETPLQNAKSDSSQNSEKRDKRIGVNASICEPHPTLESGLVIAKCLPKHVSPFHLLRINFLLSYCVRLTVSVLLCLSYLLHVIFSLCNFSTVSDTECPNLISSVSLT
jgi:hypothetical protein